MKKADYPRTVKKGSVSVRIYRFKRTNAKNTWVYSVAWTVNGRRTQVHKSTAEEAELLAKEKLEAIASGQIEMASLSKADLQIYSEACRLAADVPLIAALEEWRKARRLVGPDLLRACESWATKHNLGGLLP